MISKVFKRDQVEVHFFLEPVNLESILAVFIFCRFSASFALDFVKILRASMSILAAMFVTRFNSYCSVCFKWKLSPLLLRHRKFANEKKQAFFQVELSTNFLNCLRRATALYNLGILAILLASTKSLKFFRLFLFYFAAEAGIVFLIFPYKKCVMLILSTGATQFFLIRRNSKWF